MSIDFTPHALFDIDNAAEYIEARRAGSAARFQAELDRVFKRLERLPESGPALDPPSARYPAVRVARLPKFHYAVYYRPTADGVLIVRVIHPARDSDAILYSDPDPPTSPGS